jgi:hypothetical protein
MNSNSVAVSLLRPKTFLFLSCASLVEITTTASLRILLAFRQAAKRKLLLGFHGFLRNFLRPYTSL